MSVTRRVVFLAMLAAAVFAPSAASAQWYFNGYLGGNYTQAADIRIQQPGAGVDLTYSQVSWEAKPLEAPQYYGYRFGHMGPKGRIGLEFEFLHLKAYAIADEPVDVVGKIGATIVSGTERMDKRVTRYSMSHGLNFVLINAVIKTPIPSHPGTAFVIRGGTGPTLPHGESEIFGVAQEQYEWSSFGVHGAAGLETRLAGRLLAIAEYKFTFAKPTITVAGGTGQTTAGTHQIALGLGLDLGRGR